jgi:hypothetical protein
MRELCGLYDHQQDCEPRLTTAESAIPQAALEPTTIGVPEYRDEIREYLEIAILVADLRLTARSARLTALIHRAIPYPVVLVVSHGGSVSLSLAHERLSLNEATATVVDGAVISSSSLAGPTEVELDEMSKSFLESISLNVQPRAHLCAVYQGWINRVEALLAARISGRFAVAASLDAAAQRRTALAEYDRIQKEIVGLRSRAMKESQINRRVDLNLSIRRLEGELAALKERL